MTILADVGVVAYNGYQFDGASQVRIKCEPVYDDANRTVIYHRYVVTVTSIVADSGGTGLSMLDIRARLTKAGQALTVYNKGFYNLFVNQSSPDGFINDVAFGPKPKLISWEPIGSLYACEIVWECEACIAYCGAPKYHQGLLAFNYELAYALDYRGLTTRRISGYYEIAMTRNGNLIPDTADNYRHLVTPVIPTRFQRTTHTFRLSLDKRRCDFTITDQELPSNNPWPLGVVKVDAKHRVNWTRPKHKLRNTITVDIEMAPDQPMLNAYAIFAAIVKKRLDIARSIYGTCVLLENVSAEEGLFDRNCSFSVQYTILASLKKLLSDTGLWTPLGISSWGEWAYSISGITDNRGYANLRHLAANDTIIDPCGAVLSIPFDASATEETQKPQKVKGLLKNETPPADKSWQEFNSHVYVMRNRATIRHAILQTPEGEDGDYTPQATDGLKYPALGGLADIIQRSGKSRYTAVLCGSARRAGHPIPRPSLSMIGTATATETGGDFITKIEKNLFGVPIYVAKWQINYALSSEPGVVQPMPNFAQEVAADGTASQPDDV